MRCNRKLPLTWGRLESAPQTNLELNTIMQLVRHGKFSRCAWSQVIRVLRAHGPGPCYQSHVQLLVNSLISTLVSWKSSHTSCKGVSAAFDLIRWRNTHMERGGRGRHGRVSPNAPDCWSRRMTLKNSAAPLASAIRRAFGERFSLTLKFSLMGGFRGSFTRQQPWSAVQPEDSPTHGSLNHAQSQSSTRDPRHGPARPSGVGGSLSDELIEWEHVASDDFKSKKNPVSFNYCEL